MENKKDDNKYIDLFGEIKLTEKEILGAMRNLEVNSICSTVESITKETLMPMRNVEISPMASTVEAKTEASMN